MEVQKSRQNETKLSEKNSYSTEKESSIFQNKKASFQTLGCKLNFAETSALSDLLAEQGVSRTKGDEIADICFINTCSVTETSDHKCRQAIHKAIRENPGAFIVVTGCYAQLSSKEIAAIQGVDLVVGMEQKGQIIEFLKERLPLHEQQKKLQVSKSLHEAITVPLKDIHTFVPSCSHGERTRFFLKVQDGCNYYCTYCTIPFARGNSRNDSIANIVKQAELAAAQGGQEIVITGVNIGDFGRSTGEDFFSLIRELDKVKGIIRYRISSIEPNLLTKEIIDYCASSRAFMPHFHIPLQSGSDEVLRFMHRRYDTAFFAEKILYIKEKMPDAFIGVDVIVGTRGETDELFEQAFHFAKSIDVSQYHVFSYSERPGTLALKIPYVVSEETKHERSHRLLELSEEKRMAFYSRYRQTVRPVLLEHAHNGLHVKGFTDNYIRVELPQLHNDDHDNQLVNVLLEDFNQDYSALIGKIIES
ncbi:MAG: tRNA (N(6)-L-threonylcarbamoyladenosine(37)-C(2))-methylthiotransferase MtaB [Bacteroidaceae bacterium]|jgi:threonylcarbamoyladenosine tRNA methylthiotransferase MtaB|nr:tRNA (N(6)-L-threonylcarbamoyladenosine(37)-C(2))-methylthiotransferase MtaB [Bacteroidaceae bacterium]